MHSLIVHLSSRWWSHPRCAGCALSSSLFLHDIGLFPSPLPSVISKPSSSVTAGPCHPSLQTCCHFQICFLRNPPGHLKPQPTDFIPRRLLLSGTDVQSVALAQPLLPHLDLGNRVPASLLPRPRLKNGIPFPSVPGPALAVEGQRDTPNTHGDHL